MAKAASWLRDSCSISPRNAITVHAVTSPNPFDSFEAVDLGRHPVVGTVDVFDQGFNQIYLLRKEPEGSFDGSMHFIRGVLDAVPFPDRRFLKVVPTVEI
jgi:hypothetical protein